MPNVCKKEDILLEKNWTYESLSYIYFLFNTYILVYYNSTPEKDCIITKYIYIKFCYSFVN